LPVRERLREAPPEFACHWVHVAARLEALRRFGVEVRYEEVRPLIDLPARDIADRLSLGVRLGSPR